VASRGVVCMLVAWLMPQRTSSICVLVVGGAVGAAVKLHCQAPVFSTLEAQALVPAAQLPHLFSVSAHSETALSGTFLLEA
jgi:hypothetical protein